MEPMMKNKAEKLRRKKNTQSFDHSSRMIGMRVCRCSTFLIDEYNGRFCYGSISTSVFVAAEPHTHTHNHTSLNYFRFVQSFSIGQTFPSWFVLQKGRHR